MEVEFIQNQVPTLAGSLSGIEIRRGDDIIGTITLLTPPTAIESLQHVVEDSELFPDFPSTSASRQIDYFDITEKKLVVYDKTGEIIFEYHRGRKEPSVYDLNVSTHELIYIFNVYIRQNAYAENAGNEEKQQLAFIAQVRDFLVDEVETGIPFHLRQEGIDIYV